MEQAADYAQAHEMTNHFAAGGFRDMTRIAESELWVCGLPFATNGPLFWIVLKISKTFGPRADLIKAEDENAIWEFFDNGRKKRKEMKFTKRVVWKVPIFLWMCFDRE